MKIAVRANEKQKLEFLSKNIADNISIQWIKQDENLNAHPDVYFDLLFDDINLSNNILATDILVFANAVSCTCKEINRSNYFRINAWNGFLSNQIIEVATDNEQTKKNAENILNELNWNFIWVPDVSGMITARVISMLINEAYFALQDEVSTKEEIDIAMKLGTNYPYGPFEWAEKIGLQKVYHLLKKLNDTSSRYEVSQLLQQEAKQNIL